MREKSETAGGGPAACCCNGACETCECLNNTETAPKNQLSIAAAIQRYTERERRRKPQIVNRPMRRNGYRGKR